MKERYVSWICEKFKWKKKIWGNFKQIRKICWRNLKCLTEIRPKFEATLGKKWKKLEGIRGINEKKSAIIKGKYGGILF